MGRGISPQRVGPVVAVLGLTLVGFVGAGLLAQAGVRRDAEHRAEVAAAQVRGRIQYGASLAVSLGGFMATSDAERMTDEEFASNASKWLSPSGFPAAGWVEAVAADERLAYERRRGAPIVVRNQRRRIVPAGRHPDHLAATLVSGVPPIAVPGIDLAGEPGMRAAVRRTRSQHEPSATPLATLRDGTQGLFVVSLAQSGGRIGPGLVVVFLPEPTLRAAVADTRGLRIVPAGAGPQRLNAVTRSFDEAGQRFEVVVEPSSPADAAAVLPWIILTAGLVLAGLAAALGSSAARRARAQEELDRVFELSNDLIAVADIEGRRFTRVNPAGERILGYSREELLARPYTDFVHPDDRDVTAAEVATAIENGRRTLSFENRYIHKDGSVRVLEWQSTHVVEDGVAFSVARDVTERRQAERELEALVAQQAALRRVATLVAQGATPAAVFDAVAAETAQLLGAERVVVGRYEAAAELTVLAAVGAAETTAGARAALDEDTVEGIVRRTGSSARVDRPEGVTLGAPIVVESSTWGVLAVRRATPPPAGAGRLEQFAQLLATAIANADSRDQLMASRARLLAAGDDARRRVARDLHDGAQQRLVHTIIVLKLARRAFGSGIGDARALVREALEHAEQGNVELRELAHGILPALLTTAGLQAAIKALVTRFDVPVAVEVTGTRFAAETEASAYFIVAEALTNVVKHARAPRARVAAAIRDGELHLEIRDDGIGGADPNGQGLVGMRDRATALGGQLEVHSPPGGGTRLSVTLPL